MATSHVHHFLVDHFPKRTSVYFVKMAANFDQLMEAAKVTAIDTAALLGTRIEKKKLKGGRKGPPKTTVKAKFYHLPDVAKIPTFNPKKEVDPRVREHMSHGYGKLMRLNFLSFLS